MDMKNIVNATCIPFPCKYKMLYAYKCILIGNKLYFITTHPKYSNKIIDQYNVVYLVNTIILNVGLCI